MRSAAREINRNRNRNGNRNKDKDKDKDNRILHLYAPSWARSPTPKFL